MPEVVASFTTVMSLVILGLASLALVLLTLSVWRLPSHQGRALLGVGAMVLVLFATVASVFLLAQHSPRSGPSLRLVLPLLAALLMACLYVLTFPPLVPSRLTLTRRRRLWLLLLTGLAGVSTAGLVLLELLAP
jgi:amino acid transporter